MGQNEPEKIVIAPKIGAVIVGGMSDIKKYDGDYEITPSDVEQILHTDGLKMVDNVVIAPIPPDYGKIEWDGAKLRVF